MNLRVNPILCVGHGACAELLPELITLDEWGYPIITARTVPHELEAHARRAVEACPALALLLTPTPAPTPARTPARTPAPAPTPAPPRR